jgi:drug/metabolite transporter (DMT)-like permease
MGEFFALSCGLAWAFAVICFKRAGETVDPLALNLFRICVSSVLFLLTMLVMGVPLFGQAPLKDYLILLGSGVIAISLADTLFHASLNRVGAGINAIVDTFYSPFTLLFAFFMLGEKLSPSQLLGMVLIIAAVVVSTRVKVPEGITRRTLVTGILLGVCAMAFLSFGIVLAKPVLERSHVLWSTAVRQFGALFSLAPLALTGRQRRKSLAAFRFHKGWKFTLGGTLLGSYLSLMLWIAGMKYLPASKAAILNQMATIYILILATVLLKEPFTLRKAIASSLAVVGVLFVLGLFRLPQLP